MLCKNKRFYSAQKVDLMTNRLTSLSALSNIATSSPERHSCSSYLHKELLYVQPPSSISVHRTHDFSPESCDLFTTQILTGERSTPLFY